MWVCVCVWFSCSLVGGDGALVWRAASCLAFGGKNNQKGGCWAALWCCFGSNNVVFSFFSGGRCWERGTALQIAPVNTDVLSQKRKAARNRKWTEEEGRRRRTFVFFLLLPPSLGCNNQCLCSLKPPPPPRHPSNQPKQPLIQGSTTTCPRLAASSLTFKPQSLMAAHCPSLP